MKRPTILAALSLLLLTPHTTPAQAHKTFGKRPDDKEIQKQAKKFEIVYDKFNDLTYLRSGWSDLNSTTSFSAPNFYLSCRYKGTEAKGTPIGCNMMIVATSDTWRFLDDRNLIMLIDGEREDFGRLAHDGDVQRGRRSVSVVERMPVPLSLEQMRQIGGASKIELRLGRQEYFFTPGNLAVFMEMVRQLEAR